MYLDYECIQHLDLFFKSLKYVYSYSASLFWRNYLWATYRRALNVEQLVECLHPEEGRAPVLLVLGSALQSSQGAGGCPCKKCIAPQMLTFQFCSVAQYSVICRMEFGHYPQNFHRDNRTQVDAMEVYPPSLHWIQCYLEGCFRQQPHFTSYMFF